MYIETKKDLRRDLRRAELRAKLNFEKLMKIEQLIKKADEKHEMAILTLKDIKRVLSMT